MKSSRLVRLSLLCLHVVSSVAWLGAIAAFLLFALMGLSTRDVARLSVCATALQWLGWWLVVPLCVAAFVSGILQSAITGWGLVQHYWVLIKLLAMITATILLMVHMKVVDELAGMPLASSEAAAPMFSSLVFDAALAMILAVVLTAFSIFKPSGRIFDRERVDSEN